MRMTAEEKAAAKAAKDAEKAAAKAAGDSASFEGKSSVEGVRSAGVATVHNKTGQPVRTYRKDEHGDDFGKLAEEYAKKIGGSVR